jgi:acyl carrier protein
MATTFHSPIPVETFAETALIKALTEWWDAEIDIRNNDPFARPGTLYDLVVDIDSLSMVNLLLEIEPTLGFKPPVTVIKRGGYRSCQEMIDHLVPAIREHYRKHSNIKSI